MYARNYARQAASLLVAALVIAAGPAAANVNKSISIEDGEQAGSQSTVNGRISVGSGATITGSVETVNGAIRIGDSARIEGVSTVNGSIRAGDGLVASSVESVNGTIRLGSNTQVEGEVSVVNGKIEVGASSNVGGDVSTVNGEISLSGVSVGGDLSTVSGDILVTDGSTVQGDIVIEKPGGWNWGSNRRSPKIVIGPNSRVLGEIRAEREIELYISDSASVGGASGEADLDDATRFSGDRP